MHEKIDTLYQLCETIDRELKDANEKIRASGGKLSAGDVDYIDKLTHTLKSIKTTIAMMEAEEDGDGYSQWYMPRYGGMSYQGGSGGNRGGNSRRGGRGMSYQGGNSYARGRNNNPTGRNQYSREGGYSYADSMEEILEDMREMIGSLPEDKRRKAERLIDELSM